MGNQFEQADLDEQWFLSKCDLMRKRVTVDQIDDFVDRTWQLISVHSMGVDEARTKALNEVFN